MKLDKRSGLIILIMFMPVLVFSQIMPPDEVLQEIEMQRTFSWVFLILIIVAVVFGIKKFLK